VKWKLKFAYLPNAQVENMERPNLAQLRKLVGVANYQFGPGVGQALFNNRVRIECSRRTGRIRHIYRKGHLIATLRPTDGYLALTPKGAHIVLSKVRNPRNIVMVRNDVSEVIRSGGDVFAKHVTHTDMNIRPAEEVIVIDEKRDLTGVGRAVLSGREMTHFTRGVAVKIRKGVDTSAREPGDS
jgi:7-cyano-7-deazaguanine tRNA-ribosyltransferase